MGHPCFNQENEHKWDSVESQGLWVALEMTLVEYLCGSKAKSALQLISVACFEAPHLQHSMAEHDNVLGSSGKSATSGRTW